MKTKTVTEWLTLIITVMAISGACFAGTSKLMALLLQEQFNEIYARLNCVETNMKVYNERINGINDTVNKIWYKVK